MSLLNSIGAALVAAGKFVGRFTWGAGLVVYLDEYTTLTTDDAASTITMFTPKKGEKYAGMGQLAWDTDMGTTVTLSVGIAGAVDKFLAATDTASAADKADLDAGATACTALGYEFDGLTPVIVTQAGGDSVAAIKIKLMMVMISCN